MFTRTRSAFPLVALLALAACSPEVEPKGCRSDDQCPRTSRCQGGICVAEARPVATIRPLAPVEEFALVEIDGSEGHDPDGDDGMEYLWTVRSVTARCAAPELAGLLPIARVRFGCTGRFEVSLAVRDVHGVESLPAIAEIEVLPSSGAPVVKAGQDLSSEHACSGTPLVCRPTQPLGLSASTSAPGLALRWSVEPPLDCPLEDGTRRVRLTPGKSGTTVAEIETDGTAISGDWIFRVEASDAYGVVGAAYTRVSIRNRAPVVVAEAPAAFPHAFDAALARFASSGEIAWSAHDPDGDPIEVAATWRHVGDGGATFAGVLADGKASFAVEVPYTTPTDALFLRGGANLARTIELVARDANRGDGRLDVPIDIGNRPPEPAGGEVDARVPHTFDASRSRYVATVQLGAWTDPDGDPLFGGAGTAPCEAIHVVDGIAHAECSVEFDGTPAADRIAGFRSVSAAVRDPWILAATIPVHGVEILNSPPSLEREVDPSAACARVRTDVWEFTCPVSLLVNAVEFTVSPKATDPDGDPLLVAPILAPGGTAAPERAVCSAEVCVPFRIFQPAVLFPCLTRVPYTAPTRLRATDGAASIEVDASPLWTTGC